MCCLLHIVFVLLAVVRGYFAKMLKTESILKRLICINIDNKRVNNITDNITNR